MAVKRIFLECSLRRRRKDFYQIAKKLTKNINLKELLNARVTIETDPPSNRLTIETKATRKKLRCLILDVSQTS